MTSSPTGQHTQLLGAGAFAVVAVLVSRLLTPRATVENDVSYYQQWAQWAGAQGFSGAMREYPTPVALLLWLPSLVATTPQAYFWTFVLIGILMAVATTWVLMHLTPRAQGQRAAVVFLLGLGALGPITFYRFDLLPGALLALACVLLARGRNGWSVAVALGTGIKLWPVLTWPLVLGRRSTRRREVASFVATGSVLVGVSVAVAGWHRLFSPLEWQSGRGLQVESVLASWVLLGRTVSPSTWEAELSKANSWDFSGPGVEATLAVGTVAQLVLLAWTGILTVRMWRTREAQAPLVALAASSVVALLLATNKVFSPQYLMWLIPVAAVALALGGRALPRWWAPALITCAFLTQLSYPAVYGWLYSGSAGWTFLLGTTVMLTRNVLVVALAVSMCRAAWWATRAPRHSSTVALTASVDLDAPRAFSSSSVGLAPPALHSLPGRAPAVADPLHEGGAAPV
ncbi:MAG: glycosyltransferase 87 family protein, partial [Propionibacterium sp.]|nr:glycosyltransferase 87 family protein [Propionibacterium sp.]